MNNYEKKILAIGLIVCILLIVLSFLPLFGINQPYLFLIIAIPTCIILTGFAFKVKYDLFQK